jgi:hypothetical protein
MAISSIFHPFSKFCGHLVHIFYGHLVFFFTAIWYILWLFGIYFSRFGTLYQEKSGNPALNAYRTGEGAAIESCRAARSSYDFLTAGNRDNFFPISCSAFFPYARRNPYSLNLCSFSPLSPALPCDPFIENHSNLKKFVLSKKK